MKHTVIKSMPDEALAVRWNAFLADAPFATHYVTPNYFTDPYVRGQRFAVLAVEDDDRIVASLTGVFDAKKIVSGLFSRPQMVFCTRADREKAVSGLLDGLDELNAGSERSIELYAWQERREFAGHGMLARASNAETSVVMIDLSAGADAIFAEFSQTRRNELRKALKQDLVEVKELETDGELAELYRIYCDWNTRKGNAPDTFERMQTAAGQHANRRIFIAKTDGKVIAGSFYRFCPGGVVEYAANFSLPEYQRLRPNDLIGWHAIQWACGKGFSHFSMGGSHLFLRRFGGEVMTTYRYTRDERAFGMHRLTESVRELGIDTYKRLPENVRAGVRRVLEK